MLKDNASPTTKPTAGYVNIHNLSFPPINPNALGIANKTPINTLGNISQRIATKLNPLGKTGPVARIVIAKQQARL